MLLVCVLVFGSFVKRVKVMMLLLYFRLRMVVGFGFLSIRFIRVFVLGCGFKIFGVILKFLF